MWRLSLSLFCNVDEFEADNIYDDDIDDDSNYEHRDDDDVRVLLQNYLWRYHTSKTLLDTTFGLKTTCGGAIGGRHLLSPTSTS